MSLKKYKCHKEVWALKIEKIEYNSGGEAMLYFEEKRHSPYAVGNEFVERYDPQIGGYLVRDYVDYSTYLPGKYFENNFTEIETPKDEFDKH